MAADGKMNCANVICAGNSIVFIARCLGRVQYESSLLTQLTCLCVCVLRDQAVLSGCISAHVRWSERSEKALVIYRSVSERLP